jgi:hypothetical protein
VKVGDAVRWTGDSVDYNTVGLVTLIDDKHIYVLWANGDLVDYDKEDLDERLEVICK